MRPIIIPFFVCLYLFSTQLLEARNMTGKAEKDAAVGYIINNTTSTLEKRHRIRGIGTLVCSPGGIVEALGLSFQVYRRFSKEEARKLVVNCAEELLIAINTNEHLKPYMETYPFTQKNISVNLFINKEDGHTIYHPDLIVASAAYGTIVYSTLDPDNEYQYKTSISEPFEEAVRILNETTKPIKSDAGSLCEKCIIK